MQHHFDNEQHDENAVVAQRYQVLQHSFCLHGIRVPIVGNICMDLLMIDVTGLIAELGDEVVVFNDEQRLSDMASLLGTIPYEVLTSISPRVRRVYFRE